MYTAIYTYDLNGNKLYFLPFISEIMEGAAISRDPWWFNDNSRMRITMALQECRVPYIFEVENTGDYPWC